MVAHLEVEALTMGSQAGDDLEAASPRCFLLAGQMACDFRLSAGLRTSAAKPDDRSTLCHALVQAASCVSFSLRIASV